MGATTRNRAINSDRRRGDPGSVSIAIRSRHWDCIFDPTGEELEAHLQFAGKSKFSGCLLGPLP
jgi:hypothetical protein